MRSPDTTARRPWLRIALIAAVVAMLVGPSCAPGFDSPSKVSTLRVLSVTVDNPYAQPGDDVTFRMTLFDGKGSADGQRTVQIVWLGGCFNPAGDLFYLCFEQIAETLAPLAQQGAMPDTELIKVDIGLPQSSGQPDFHEFTLPLPSDLVSQRKPPPAGPHYGIAYVFFAACAGTLAPADLTNPGGGEVPDFPLECRNAAGEKLGSDSFVIGYTQVYAFADGRDNANPPIRLLKIDNVPVCAAGEKLLDDNSCEPQEDPALADPAPVVERCPVTEDERRDFSCGADDPTDSCKKYEISAVIDDVAEDDPESVDPDGTQLREVVWVSYFAEAGDIDKALLLVSDAVEGHQGETKTEWTPPDQPGPYQIWVVVRDQRGGSSVVRRVVDVR